MDYEKLEADFTASLTDSQRDVYESLLQNFKEKMFEAIDGFVGYQRKEVRRRKSAVNFLEKAFPDGRLSVYYVSFEDMMDGKELRLVTDELVGLGLITLAMTMNRYRVYLTDAGLEALEKRS
jgi:hypothetical protein